MTTDRVFVLLMMVLLMMAGCFEATSTTEAEEEFTTENDENKNAPIVFGNARYTNHYENGNVIENVLIVEAMAKDFDGSIIEFGIDLNLDGEIDYFANHTSDELEIVSGNLSETYQFELTKINEGQDGQNYCYQWAALIAVDDDGFIGVKTFQVLTALNDNWSEGCTNEALY